MAQEKGAINKPKIGEIVRGPRKIQRNERKKVGKEKRGVILL